MGFLMGFFYKFYGFSASGYVMTTLDELNIIPPGEFINSKKLSKVTIKKVTFFISLTFLQNSG